MKKLFALLLCISIALGLSQTMVYATESTKATIPENQIIKNDETGIPDPNLYASVLRSVDDNQDGILTKSEALNLKHLVFSQPFNSTMSLKGLKYLKNVTHFYNYEGGNFITDPYRQNKLTNQEELKNLGELEYICLGYIGNLDLDVISEMNNVNYLSLIHCDILDKNTLSLLSNMKSLKYLDICALKNGLNGYDLDLISNCKQITELHLVGNKISTVKPLAKMTNLKELGLGNNLIKTADALIELKNLEVLGLGNNLIKNIDSLVVLSNLKRLLLGDNYLKVLPDLKPLKGLEELSLGYNYLTKEEILAKVSEKFTNDENFMTHSLLQKEGDDIIIDDNEMVGNLERPYSKVLDEIPADMIDRVYDAKDGIAVSFSNPVSIPSNVFEVAKKEKKVISFEILDENGKLEYSWTFDGKSNYSFIPTGDSLNLEMNFNSSKKAEIEKITNFKDAFYMNFTHHGDLPYGATMKVKVDSKYKDGDTVFLYYFNEEKGAIDLITSPGIKVENGYASFVIYHCSTYFLVDKTIESKVDITVDTNNDNKQIETPTPSETVEEVKKPTKTPIKTGDNTSIAILVTGMVLAVSGIVLMKKKEN